MKIEKGIVKYKDRSDIVCTYGTTEDGTKYYFLDENDEKKFTNGNRIVSSLLVEAIDPMVKASNIGVIDGNGVVVIPCVNRSIRTVDDNTILVEAAVPISQSVIDSVELRNDPLAATKLVSTPALIKDKINASMGGEGKYLFNDQFSEATVCDINGNNLIDNEYYSFIAQANGKLYMSKNVADSDVKELVLTTDSLDLGSVSVSQDVVEDALGNNGFAEKSSVLVDALASNEEVAAPVDGLASDEEVAAPVDGLASDEEVAAPVDGLVSDEEEIIPYNDDISTVVDESNMLENKTPDFLTAEDMVSSTNNTPPVVEDSDVNEDSLGVNIGAEAGFDVMPTDMNVVAPYNEGLASTVNDSLVETAQEASPVAEDVVNPYNEGLASPVNDDLAETAQETTPVAEDVVNPYNESLASTVNDSLVETAQEASPVAEDVVNPYNEGLASPVNDSLVETAQETTPAAQDVVVEEKNEDVTVVAEEAKTDDVVVPEETVDAVAVKEEVVSQPPVVDMPVSVNETAENNDTSTNTIDVITTLGGNDNQIDSDVVIPEVVPQDEDNSVKVENDTDDVVTASDNNVYDVISGVDNNSQSAPIKLDEGVSLPQPAEKLGEETVSGEPLTIDANDVASIVDKDGNGINDSIDNGGIVDIFKETATPAPVDTTVSSNSSLKSSLDFLSNDYYVPRNSFDRRPIESFGSHEYSVPSNSQYNSLFTDTKSDKLPYGDDNIMSDVVRSMGDLMKQNREQRSTIVQYQERLDAVEAQRRMAIEQYKQTAVRVEALSSKLRALEESSTRLEARNQMYETRLRDQEKIIASQERELKTLRPQLEGKQDLVKLLADAKALLGSDSDYSTYDDGSNYYRRVA